MAWGSGRAYDDEHVEESNAPRGPDPETGNGFKRLAPIEGVNGSQNT